MINSAFFSPRKSFVRVCFGRILFEAVLHPCSHADFCFRDFGATGLEPVNLFQISNSKFQISDSRAFYQFEIWNLESEIEYNWLREQESNLSDLQLMRLPSRLCSIPALNLRDEKIPNLQSEIPNWYGCGERIWTFNLRFMRPTL